ncbi:helix-turn-helix domain-containing protein, partial [Demequina muriae]
LFSEPEVADYLGISTITLARYRKAGKIGCIMIGPTPKYTEHHITAYLEAQQCNVSSSAFTGSNDAKARPTGSGRGATEKGSSSALLLAQQILSKPKSP